MSFRNVCLSAAIFCGFACLLAAEARSEDWMQKSIKVAGGGTFNFEHPEAWGKKPDLDAADGITTVRFGPYGTRTKPVFLVHIESVTANEPVSDEAIAKVTKLEVAELKKIAAETSITINDLKGPDASGQYFSITDRASKRGEYDYLTLAILGSGPLLVKCYFFSSDGAPDFGADAMQMMRSINYAPPPPEPEGKSRRR